jgi:virginiamycin B lyase
MKWVGVRRASSGRLRNPRLWLLVAGGIVVALAAGAAVTGRIGPWARWGFVEFKMLSRTDIPVAVAVAPDGTVWFTLEASDAMGRLRDGAIQKVGAGKENLEPLGLAVDADGSVWYTNALARAIARIAPDGAVTAFPLSTPVARLGRLSVAADGAVWFAEPTTVSVTRLKDGIFTRYMVGPPSPVGASNVGPFGVAVDPQGTVWATLQNANKLARILPGGEMTALTGAAPSGCSNPVRTRSRGSSGAASRSSRSPRPMPASRLSPSLPTGRRGSRNCAPTSSVACATA